MINQSYIGYIDAIGTTVVPSYTGEPISSIVSTVILTAAASWKEWFSHPIQDAKDTVSVYQRNIAPYTDITSRLAEVILTCNKISKDAKQIEANDLIYWYRTNYPNDYKSLTPEDKIAFNQYLDFAINNYGYSDYQLANDYKKSYFTDAEINYGNTSTGLSSVFQNKYVLYSLIGLGVLLLIKK